MAIEIVDLPIENGGSFHSYVSLPQGTYEKFGIYLGSPDLHPKWVPRWLPAFVATTNFVVRVS